MTKPRTCSCLECGESFIAHQPDDFHIQASLKKEGLRDPVEIEVLRILKKFNWTVFPQYHFIDPTSNKDERDYGVN